MGRIIPYIVENKKCLKPPTKYYKLTYPTLHLPTHPSPKMSGNALTDAVFNGTPGEEDLFEENSPRFA
jgi:hypothetical protein